MQGRFVGLTSRSNLTTGLVYDIRVIRRPYGGWRVLVWGFPDQEYGSTAELDANWRTP